jgi:hypothetical protein
LNEIELGATVHLPLNELELGDLSFHLTVRRGCVMAVCIAALSLAMPVANDGIKLCFDSAIQASSSLAAFFGSSPETDQ